MDIGLYCGRRRILRGWIGGSWIIIRDWLSLSAGALVWDDALFDRNNTKLIFYEDSNTLLPSSASLVYASGVCFRVSMAAGVGHVSAK